MKTTDWITLCIGIGTIIATFAGAWLGAYISGRNAAKQSISTLGLQLKYEMLITEIKEIKNKTTPIVELSKKLNYLTGIVGETLESTKDSSSSNDYYLREVKQTIDFLVDDICNIGEVSLSNDTVRAYIDIKVQCKKISSLYETIMNEKEFDVRGYSSESLAKIIKELDVIFYSSEALAKITKQIVESAKIIERELKVALERKEKKTKELEAIYAKIYHLVDSK